MKPFELIQGDALTVVRSFPDDAFDFCISDPPYNAKTHKGARRVKKGVGSAVLPISFPPIDRAYLEKLIPEVLRVTKRWVLFFCALEDLGMYSEIAGKTWIRSGIWVRPDGTPQLTGDRPAQGAEGIAILHRKGKKFWNRRGDRGVWTCGVDRKDRFAETPKPDKLMVKLVQDFTLKGEHGLDLFMGSATTGVACIRTGRRFTGVELDAEDKGLLETARKRLQAEVECRLLRTERAGDTRQGDLFGVVGQNAAGG